MKKIRKSGLFYGLLLMLVFLIIRPFNEAFVHTYAGIAGGGLCLLAMVFSGSLNPGDRMRANFHTESSEDRRNRISLSGFVLGLGFPTLLLWLALSLWGG